MNDNPTSSPDPSLLQQGENTVTNPAPEHPEILPSPPPRRRLTGLIISWLLILAAVATSQLPEYRKDGQSSPEGFQQDLTIQVTGRYIIGMKGILGNNPAVELSIPQLRKSVEQSDNPRKRLFFVPILAELTTRDEALTELERITPELSDDAVNREALMFLQLYRKGSDSLTLEQIRSIERYGWIGKLALSQDKPASDPSRRAVLQSATKTFLTTFFFAIGAMAALAVGSVVLIFAIVFRVKKQLHFHFKLPEDSGHLLLQAFAIFITGLITLPALAQWLLPDFQILQILASFLTFPIVALALAWPCFRGSKWNTVRTALGLHRGKGFFREAGAGILGYLAGVPLLAIALIPVLVISRNTGTVPAHPIVNEIGSDPVTIVLLMVLACVWAPVIEETFFRGFLYTYFRRRLHWSVTGITTGLLFAVIHPQGLLAVPVLATIGFTLGAIREWRGSIVASMTAHAFNNGAVLILATFSLT